jgi:hypothetical protein
MIGLTRTIARQIIERVGSSGSPPEWGFQFFTAGLDWYLEILEEDYLKTFIKEGGASFKMVVGTYGGGKTHFLYNIRELAWKNNYVVSYCSLSPEESPFYRLEKVYKSVVENLMYPLTPEELFSGREKGIEAFLKLLYEDARESFDRETTDNETLVERLTDYAADLVKGIESVNFTRAIREAFIALTEGNDTDFEDLIQWIKVEGYDRHIHRRFGILQPIDRGQAFSALRSLIQWIRNLRYNGLVILFDEAEQVPSLTSKQRELMLNNIREIIDECGHAAFKNVMIFYAIPTEAFFEGKSGVYEALKQRIATVFDFYNPTGVKINLEQLGQEPETLLKEIGRKLLLIYETAFKISLPEKKCEDAIAKIAHAAYEQRFGDIGYKRLFVQALIRGLHFLQHEPSAQITETRAFDMVQK